MRYFVLSRRRKVDTERVINFLGLPSQISVCWQKKFDTLTLPDLKSLLRSSIHEYRLTSLLIMMRQFERGNHKQKLQLINLYKANLRYVNDWDLVDSSAPHLLGRFLRTRSKVILDQYARSPNIWRRRVAILSTFEFIKQGEYKHVLRIGKILLNDKHDLIHKAVGWILREIGNRDKEN